MKKIMVIALSTMLLGGGFALASQLDSSSTLEKPVLSGEQVADESGETTTKKSEPKRRHKKRDVSGPCDEAEHAGEARCAETSPSPDQASGQEDGGTITAPIPSPAQQPSSNGTAGDDDDDRAGKQQGHDDDDDEADDDDEDDDDDSGEDREDSDDDEADDDD